ncbi:MAG: antitoxin [Pseudomonadota bacterium]
MRTTLTIDPDVESLLDHEVRRSHKPLKQVVNEALRRGLTRTQAKPRRLELKVHDSQLRPGYDPASFNRLADELEDTETLRKSR